MTASDPNSHKAATERAKVGPAVISVAVHSMLVLTLLAIEFEPTVQSNPSIINVQLWRIDDEQAASEDEANETPGSTIETEETELPDSDTRSAAPDEALSKPNPEAAAAANQQDNAREESELDETGRDTEAAVEPDETGFEETEAQAEPDETGVEEAEARAEPAAPLVVVDELPAASSAQANIVVERSDRPVSDDGPESTAPLPERIPVPEAQQRMLDGKLDRWARNFDSAAQLQSNETWEHDGLKYTATFKQLPAEGDMGIERVAVEISTEQNGDRLSAEMRMTRLAFSSFAQFVDRWDPQVQIHDDQIDGRFHSNSEINLSSTRNVQPQFHGRVTTASRGINTSNSSRRVRRDEVFLGGLATGVRRIALPKRFQSLLDEAGVADRRLHRLEEDTRIIFYPDGTYGWTSVEAAAPEQRRPISPDSAYIVAAPNVKLHLKGILKGTALVYSPERIIIEGDLTYAHYPDMDPDPGDYLGLVSDKSVEIAPPDVTGPGDLIVNASIYAKRRFLVRNYNSRQDATLVIYGSVAAGSVSATEPRFATRIQYDRRLETARPPSFPMTDRYELEPWDGEWEVEPIDAPN